MAWWLSGLKIQCCHCCGSGSILGLGTSECHGCSQKKKKAGQERELCHCGGTEVLVQAIPGDHLGRPLPQAAGGVS